MQKYQNNVTGRNGDVVIGGSVLVKLAGTATPATIYSDNGVAPADNPLTTDANGYFEFYAADGLYDISVNGADAYTSVLIVDALTGLAGRPTASDLASSGGAELIGSLVEGTVQSSLDARPTTAALAAADGSAGVGSQTTGIAAPALKTAAERLDYRVAVLDKSGVVADWNGTTGTSASVALNQLIADTETNGQAYHYFPTYNRSYYLASSLIFELGDVQIFGDSGLQYTHPFVDGTNRLFRKGQLVGAADAGTILDLGASKTPAGGPSPARNFAQSWTVRDLSLRGLGTTAVNGVTYTGQKNGPDRPFVLRNVAGYNLNRGFQVAAPYSSIITISLATLHIEDCGFSFGKMGIEAAGPVYGARIVNCNLEANTEGAVSGRFNGALVLESCMLENTKNPVNLTPDSNLRFFAKGNYVEYHPTSDYIYRLLGADYYLIYGVDIRANITSSTLMDYPVVLEGSGRFTIKSPQYKVCIQFNTKPLIVTNESTLFADQGGIAFKGLKSSVVAYVDGGIDRTDSASAWIHNYPLDTQPFVLADTPIGLAPVIDLADGIRITPGQAIQNKLLAINLLVRADALTPSSNPPYTLQARTPGGAFVSGPGNVVDYIVSDISQGEWALVCILWRCTNNVQDIDLFVAEALRGHIQVAGATTQVLGAYVGDGTDALQTVYPASPKKRPGASFGGNGTNGYYTAFDDGTLICHRLWTADTASTSSTIQGLTVYSQTGTWVFPKAFVGATPTVNVTAGQNVASLATGAPSNVTLTGCDVRGDTLVAPSSFGLTKRATAFGRWK